MIPIAFYAPLKPPDHPNPSGDRTIARLLLKALSAGGFAPWIPSRLRSRNGTGDPAVQESLHLQAAAERRRILNEVMQSPADERPKLWFTYHSYYKAPDLIGPDVARALAIPYVIAEASRSPRRAAGPWADGHRASQAAIDAADVLIALTEKDLPELEAARPDNQTIIRMDPFIDLDEWPAAKVASPGATPRLIVVAMMRSGDKLASYTLLADALIRLLPFPWTLSIVGDGEQRPAVETLMHPLGERCRFLGAISDRATLSRLYAASDLMIWPAVNEAFGMVFLEAQLHGVVPVAGDERGVSAVVHDGKTGILVPARDPAVLAAATANLLMDTRQRQRLSVAAAEVIRKRHGLGAAAARLTAVLRPLISGTHA